MKVFRKLVVCYVSFGFNYRVVEILGNIYVCEFIWVYSDFNYSSCYFLGICCGVLGCVYVFFLDILIDRYYYFFFIDEELSLEVKEFVYSFRIIVRVVCLFMMFNFRFFFFNYWGFSIFIRKVGEGVEFIKKF